MVLSVSLLLLLGAFVAVVMASMGKAPLWVAVLLVVVLELVRLLPPA
jgi:hypothetical protein